MYARSQWALFTLLPAASPYQALNPQLGSGHGTLALELLAGLLSEIACVNQKGFNSSIVRWEKQQLRETILLHVDEITDSHWKAGVWWFLETLPATAGIKDQFLAY